MLQKKIASLTATIISFIINGIRPLLGPASCRFYPSCTLYATQTLQHEPLFKAIWLIFKRVVSCIGYRR